MVQISTNVPPTLKQAVLSIAKKERRSESDVARFLLEEGLDALKGFESISELLDFRIENPRWYGPWPRRPGSRDEVADSTDDPPPPASPVTEPDQPAPPRGSGKKNR